MAGPAYTVRYQPATKQPGNVGDFLDDVEPGAVVVIDGYPIWSAGRFMRTGKDRVRLAEVQGDLLIDGVTISPGDLVCADEDGVVVVAASSADQVVGLAEHIEKVESDIVEAVRSGSTLSQAPIWPAT